MKTAALVVLCAALCVSTGCSAPEATGADSGTALDAGSGDDARSPADSGASSEDAPSGADFGPPDDASTAPITAGDYCETTVEMFCDYYLRCGRIAAEDLADCTSTFLESCNEVYEPRYQSYEARGLLALSPEGVAACGEHLSNVECHQQLFDLDGACAGVWQGLAPQGDPCAPGIGSFVCSPDTVCTLTLDFCGTCEPAVEVGAACGDGVRCRTGAQCVEGSCVRRALPGETCSDSQPCVTGAGCVAGVCRGFDVVAVGEACDAGRRCPYKSSCRSGVCVESGLLGDSCTDRDCASGYCEANVCVPFRGVGDSCTRPNECLSLRCEAGVCGELERTCFE